MTRTKRAIAYIVGWGFIILVIYGLATVGLYLGAVISVDANRPIAFYPLDLYQRLYYFEGGGRKIWQYDPLCAVTDDELIYKPKNGTCSFSNAEFSTTLTFDNDGRSVPNRLNANRSENGIAILGDSHAMGWGVNDNQTFANVLQGKTTKPVFNLAVSSYGTGRELKRLAVSGLIDKIDTVIIQYCGNDVDENSKLVTEEDYKRETLHFRQIFNRSEEKGSFASARYVYRVVGSSMEAPFSDFKHRVIRSNKEDDFLYHHKYLRETLRRYEKLLLGKKVIVFYLNGYGARFANFPSGVDAELGYVRFYDPRLTRNEYFWIDDHLNVDGHRHIGESLADLLHSK